MFRLAGLLALGGLCLVLPAVGQESAVLTPAPRALTLDWAGQSTGRSLTLAFPLRRPALEFPASRNLALLMPKPAQSWSPDPIERMEAAFYCNDTPFIDQVRLPVAALWHGRVRLTGFESDVTTANFVLGLPGAGTLQSLNLMGSGHLAMRAPPSDQLAGMHLTISLSSRETTSFDNSGLRGLQFLARSGRDFFQTILNH